MKPPAPSLYGIAIFVSDIARATEFYRDTLGLPVTKQGSFGLELFEGPAHVGIHPAVHADAGSWSAGIPASRSMSRTCCTTAACCTIGGFASSPSRPSRRGGSWQ